jgi:acyl carrier protein
VPTSQIEPDTKFARLGLDSATSVFLVVELEDWLGLELESNVVFEHPSIGELARYVAARMTAKAAKATS